MPSTAANKRYVKRVEETPIQEANALPTHKPIAVYYRQSTDEQVNNVSTSMQKEDLPKYIQSLGWRVENIILIDEDEGVSGSKTIDERVGMSRLYDMIINGEIGAVGVMAEDRLFRDETQIQPNIYIDACRRAGVITITPHMVYNFHGKERDWHMRQFRFKAEISADYITSHIKGRVIPAKEKLAKQGIWVGGYVPLGYILDPDNRYVPFEPCAEVILEWFELLVKYEGNLGATCRHIIKNGSYYPDLNDPEIKKLIPEGHRAIVHKNLKWRGNGLVLSRPGLTHTLTNAVYLGHWVRCRQIIKENNHPAIIPEALFMQVFNYLSPINFDGSENKNYIPNIRRERTPSRSRNAPRPLYEGLIYSQDSTGNWRRAHIGWENMNDRYVYEFKEHQPIERVLWKKRANQIDEGITFMLRERMGHDTLQRVLNHTDTTKKETAKLRKRILSQIASIEKQKERYSINLGRTTDEELFMQTQERFIECRRQIEEKTQELKALDEDTEIEEAVKKLRERCHDLSEKWDELADNIKQAAIIVCIERIEATKLDDYQFEVVVHWRDQLPVFSTDTMIFYHASGHDRWRKAEANYLVQLVENGASQVEIAAKFPTRRWKHLAERYKISTGKRLQVDPRPILWRETYNDYLARIQTEEGSEQCAPDKSLSANISAST